MAKIETLQSKLEAKAKKSLEEDIQKLRAFINNSPIGQALKEFKINRGTSEKPYMLPVYDLLIYRDPLEEVVMEKLLPTRTSEIVKQFVDQVDNLQAEVDDLRNSVEGY